MNEQLIDWSMIEGGWFAATSCCACPFTVSSMNQLHIIHPIKPQSCALVAAKEQEAGGVYPPDSTQDTLLSPACQKVYKRVLPLIHLCEHVWGIIIPPGLDLRMVPASSCCGDYQRQHHLKQDMAGGGMVVGFSIYATSPIYYCFISYIGGVLCWNLFWKGIWYNCGKNFISPYFEKKKKVFRLVQTTCLLNLVQLRLVSFQWWFNLKFQHDVGNSNDQDEAVRSWLRKIEPLIRHIQRCQRRRLCFEKPRTLSPATW